MNNIANLSATGIANHFLNKSEGYSALYLHKMVYISYGFHLALTGKGLTKDKPVAYPYGAVFQHLEKACEEKSEAIGSLVFYNALPEVGPSRTRGKHLKGFFNLLWDKYGKYSGFIPHDSKCAGVTPWGKTWERYQQGPFLQIPDSDTQNHYSNLLKNAPHFRYKLKEVLA